MKVHHIGIPPDCRYFQSFGYKFQTYHLQFGIKASCVMIFAIRNFFNIGPRLDTRLIQRVRQICVVLKVISAFSTASECV